MKNPNYRKAPKYLFTDWDYEECDGCNRIFSDVKYSAGTNDDGFRPVQYVRLDLLPLALQDKLRVLPDD